MKKEKWIVVDQFAAHRELPDEWSTKIKAETAIVNCIRGAENTKKALKYFIRLKAEQIWV